MDGMTATFLLREYEASNSLRRVPVIALTGLASATARNEALESGMDQFLTKPFSFPQLREIIAGLPPIPAAA
jgi:CheY-like chemotaxis protein